MQLLFFRQLKRFAICPTDELTGTEHGNPDGGSAFSTSLPSNMKLDQWLVKKPPIGDTSASKTGKQSKASEPESPKYLTTPEDEDSDFDLEDDTDSDPNFKDDDDDDEEESDDDAIGVDDDDEASEGFEVGTSESETDDDLVFVGSKKKRTRQPPPRLTKRQKALRSVASSYEIGSSAPKMVSSTQFADALNKYRRLRKINSVPSHASLLEATLSHNFPSLEPTQQKTTTVNSPEVVQRDANHQKEEEEDDVINYEDGDERAKDSSEVCNDQSIKPEEECSICNNSLRQEADSTVETATLIESILKSLQDKADKFTKILRSRGLESPNQQKLVRTMPIQVSPAHLQLVLHEYQLVGLNYLIAVNEIEGMNCILADEMGLGKTIQTIALLSHFVNQERPHLVVVPASTLLNWQREFGKWNPSLHVFKYYGTQQERKEQRKLYASYASENVAPNISAESCSTQKQPNVILTTYNIVFSKKDRIFFKKQQYMYLVLDEAQKIKNVNSAQHQNLTRLAKRADHRLLLTGTPLQNDIGELFALIHFLMPDIVTGGCRTMKEVVLKVQQMQSTSDLLGRVKSLLNPFYIRRLKSEVSVQLKPKVKETLYVEMTEFQREHYLACCATSRTMWARYKKATGNEGYPCLKY